MTMTPRGIVVAINPSASFGRSRAAGPKVVRVLREAGFEVTALTESNFDALVIETRSAIARGTTALVVVGGDGMVSLGANIVAGTTLPLGIIPSGTGNDMARGLGIPLGDVDAAIAVLLDAIDRPPRVIDAVRVNRAGAHHRWFAGMLAAGFDAVVNERANLMRWPRGRSRYNLALFRELAVLRPRNYRLVLDGIESDTRAMLVSVGNNSSLGGGMLVAPHALLDDGLLDVLVVQPLSRLAFLRLFPRVFTGTHLTDPRVAVHRVRTIAIHSDGLVAYADGERLGELPLEIEVVPGALRVLAP